MKRALDLLVAGAALLVLSPLLLLVALGVRWSMGAPVFFTQLRPGLRGRSFRLVKFRTMRDERAADGTPLGDAQRLTRVGRLLRQTSLDELPELWNVLKGEMSLVGPRPLLPEYLPLYSPRHRRRHEVRPGLTGLAQVSGRNALSWSERFDLDVWYVEHASLALDCRILVQTVAALLRRHEVSQPGHATMERFRGYDNP